MRVFYWVFCWFLIAGAHAGELRYQVSYQGIFSAGAKIPIADLTLSARKPSSEAAYTESELSVTSAAYEFVEAFYPIRYRFRSWYTDDRSTGLVYEYFEDSQNSGKRHRLVYLDDPEQPFVARDLLTEGELDLPALLDGSYRVVYSDGRQARFDRLGLLEHVRARQLQPGEQLFAQVTNGKKMLEYQVQVEKRHEIKVAGQQRAALKLRFDAVTRDKRGREKHAHRPVFIWLSDDPRRIPLRAISRHALGKFRIELNPAQLPAQLTGASGRLVGDLDT